MGPKDQRLIRKKKKKFQITSKSVDVVEEIPMEFGVNTPATGGGYSLGANWFGGGNKKNGTLRRANGGACFASGREGGYDFVDYEVGCGGAKEFLEKMQKPRKRK